LTKFRRDKCQREIAFYLLFLCVSAIIANAHNVDKLTVVDFTNILLEAFTWEDPKSAKNTVELSVFLALLGSVCIKAVSEMLMKSTPG